MLTVINKKKIGVVLIFAFIAIQFYRPHRNSQGETTASDFLVSENASKEVRVMFKNACYDCHSNHTSYEWYDNIAPVSWFVDNTIKNGKYVLNFSEWKTMELIEKKIMLSAIPFDINNNKMPKKNYLLIKPKAILTEEDKQQINNWISVVKTNTPWEEPLNE